MTTEIKTESLSSGVVLPKPHEVGKRVCVIRPTENAICVHPDPEHPELYILLPVGIEIEVTHDTYLVSQKTGELTTAVVIRICGGFES